MSSSCLTLDAINDIQTAIKDANLSMQALSNMNTKTRSEFFGKILGDDLGSRINEKFEQNLLKIQKDSLTKWLNKQSQLSQPKRNDLMKKIDRMDKVITPKNSKPFLADIAKKRLGFAISQEDASVLLDASRKAIKTREEFLKKYPTYADMTLSERKEFQKDDTRLKDAQQVGMDNLTFELAYQITRLKYTDPTVKAAFEQGTKEGLVSIAKLIPSILKSLNATMDLSVGRQLTKAFFYDPVSAFKAEWEGLSSLVDSIKGVKQLPAMIELYSRPNFINGNYNHFGVDVGIQEEAFPTSVLQEIPGLGSLFRASEETFNVAIQHARANLFDSLWDMSSHSNYLMKDVGSFINSLTGRGKLLTDENFSKWVNILLFSPRLLSSNVEMLANVITKMPAMMRWGNATKQGDWVKHRQFIASIKFFLGEALLAIMAQAMLGDDESEDGVQFDPRSSDFMKIRSGNTTFDITGGVGAVAVWLARATTSQRMTGEGKIAEVSSPAELFEQFISGKFSPLLRTAIDANDVFGWGDGKDFVGEPMTIEKFFTNRLPISLQNMFLEDNYKDDKDAIVASMADFFGIGTTTYPRSNANLYTQKTPTRRITSNKLWSKFSVSEKSKIDQEFKDKYESRAKSWLDRNKSAKEEVKTENFKRIRQQVYDELKLKYLKKI